MRIAAMEWKVLRARPSMRIVHWGPLVCVRFIDMSDDADLHADFDAQEALIAQWGAISQIVIFEATRLRVGFNARVIAGERLKRWGPALRCSAMVLDGSGLGAQFLRVAAMTAVTLSGMSERHQLVASVGAALEWVKRFPSQVPEVAGATLAGLEAPLRRAG